MLRTNDMQWNLSLIFLSIWQKVTIFAQRIQSVMTYDANPQLTCPLCSTRYKLAHKRYANAENKQT